MRLSPEQEAELIDRNIAKINRAVDNFTARCERTVVRIDRDDFVQEATLAFLEYIRRCETEEELETFPWYDATKAMTRLVVLHQPMSGPKRPASFQRVIHDMPHTVSYETNPSAVLDVDGMSKNWVDDKDTLMDLEIFVDSLPDYADRVVAMKLWGLTSRQIAGQLGITEQAVGKRLKKYQERYHKFIEEEDSDA